MEDDNGKECKSDDSGGAAELLPLREADSGISLTSKSDEGDVSRNGVVGKDHSLSEPDSSCAELRSESSPSTTEDVDMYPALCDSNTEPSGDVEQPSSTQDIEKCMSVSPAGAEEEIMQVDADDVILTLDKAVEGSDPPNIEPEKVHLDTVIASTSHDASVPSTSLKVAVDSVDQSDLNISSKAKKSPTESSATQEGEVSSNTDEKEEGGEVVAPEDLPDLSSDSDGDDTLDSDDNVVNPSLLTPTQKSVLRRRRIHKKLFGNRNKHIFSSSSGEDSDAAMTDEDRRERESNRTERESENSNQEEEEEEEVRKSVKEVMEKVIPPPNWLVVRQLHQREYSSGRRQASSWFREGVQASLQMTRRLVTVERMKGHEGCVNALSFNRIGTLLASGSDDLDIVLWNWQKARPSVTYESGHRSNVFQAKFMPFSGDCHVISCARDGQVRLAELNSSGVCRATRKLAQHRGAAHKLALELDSPHIFLSCGEDALTYLFDLRQEKPHKLVTARENEKKVPLYSIHSNPCDSHQFCVGGRDHYIRVYDKRKISEQSDGGVLKKLCPDHLISNDFKVNVTCACYSFNGSEILGTYNDEDIYLFDNTMSDGANYVHKYSGHRNNATVKGVGFYGPRSEFIVSGSDCGHVYFWDKNTEAIINFQDGDDTGVINVLEPHPNLPVLATSGLDHDVKLWMPMIADPSIDSQKLEKTIVKNQVERNLERATSVPEIGGQMLWFIMHHYRNTARRRLREEGQVLSSTDDDDDDDDHSDDSENNHMQCAQS